MKQHAEFVTLVQNNRRLIYHIINRYPIEDNYKDDLFQDIICRAWSSFNAFRGESQFNTWIGRIARNVTIDHLRRLKTKIHSISHNNFFFEIEDTPYEEQPFPVLDILSPIEKRTLEMRINGLSYAEISKITGEPANRITVRMHRIKNLLAKSVYDHNE